MHIPLSWLAEFVAWKGTPSALAERLAAAGLAIEAIEEVGRLDRRVRAGKLLKVEPHPQADRLQVCRVDAGERAPLTVVSGAPGLATGQLVPIALAGARLPSGKEVVAADVRGIASAGMLCAESELELGDDASQVLALPVEARPGTPLADLPGIADTVFVTEVTPNRGDWLSVLGVAREIAALTGVRLKHPRPRPRESGAPAGKAVSVRITAPDLCPRYCARLIYDVRPGPSPLWVRLRLRRAGMRSIDVIVDATNYIMLERGQPLHAFDFERLGAREVIVRRARTGERMTTLDGVERTLDDADLVIATPARAVAIAGVMGGEDSEVTATTRVVLLESAFFSPSAIRRTSRRLGLPSQAAYRFERRVDPAMAPEAADAVAALIVRLAGGRVAPGIVEHAPGMKTLKPPVVRLRLHRIQALLGAAVSRTEVARRLRVLGAECRADGESYLVTAPSYRSDLHLEEDIIEEVARVGGYERIPVTLPDAPLKVGSETPGRALQRRVRQSLTAAGLAEMVTLTLTDAETNLRLGGFVGRDLGPLVLRNPLSSELSELRRSPLSGLLRALRLNLDRGAEFVGAFELGKSFGVNQAGARQESHAAGLLLCGHWPPRGAERQGPETDLFDLKGVVDNLCATLAIDPRRIRWTATRELPFLHPGKSAQLAFDGTAIGCIGALHPELVQHLDLPSAVWLGELDTQSLAHYVPRLLDIRALPRFPAVTRDLALSVADAFHADEIIDWYRALANPLIESVRLFDCYQGPPIPSGEKSLAYTIVYRATDRTLTDDEVNSLHAQIRDQLAQRFTLTFRS